MNYTPEHLKRAIRAATMRRTRAQNTALRAIARVKLETVRLDDLRKLLALAR